MSGEDIWGAMGAMSGPAVEFGPQFLPPGEDIDRSRQDTGTGWDQAVTMDRATVDRYGNPLNALAVPPGLPVSRDAVWLGLERNQGHASDEVTPLFPFDGWRERFNSPLAGIEWAPYTAVMHQGGYTSQVREDVLPQTAKLLPDYYYGVIDGQEILDQAIARTRRAMYGR